MSRISVITISFKDLEGLRRTIESVNAQTVRPDIDHIVIDGGSGEAVELYLASQTQLTYWQSCSDGGRYDAMNTGLLHAQSEFVWFLHSGDTFYNPESIETAFAAMDRTNALWGYGLASLVDLDGIARGTFGRKPASAVRFSLGGRPIPHQATIFRTKLISEIGDLDLKHGLAADQLHMLKASLLSSPVFIDAILCNFDTSGAGSRRPLHHHYVDMRRASRTAEVARGPFTIPHALASYALEGRAHIGAWIRAAKRLLVSSRSRAHERTGRM